MEALELLYHVTQLVLCAQNGQEQTCMIFFVCVCVKEELHLLETN